MICKRCGQAIMNSDNCGDYGCAYCYDGMTYKQEERIDYIVGITGLYDSRRDQNGEYNHIWAQDENAPVKHEIKTEVA